MHKAQRRGEHRKQMKKAEEDWGGKREEGDGTREE
jgi:hypothetical protein